MSVRICSNSSVGSIESDQVNKHLNDKIRSKRICLALKLSEIILLRPITASLALCYYTFKLISYVPVKIGCSIALRRSRKVKGYLTEEVLKTARAIRDVVFIPSVAKRVFLDMIATSEKFVDDISRKQPEDYLNTRFTTGFEQYTSYQHGCNTFKVIYPEQISEVPAAQAPDLKAVKASHFLAPNKLAINFGIPNVAAFVTEESDQTVKVDAKSLYRAPMTYHPTNGKMQSGVFLVPTNLPDEALRRFRDAAENMAKESRKDITCVNTNCRVLQNAGFSIEGIALDQIVFPNSLMEHLLFRNVFYTDESGLKHRIHFDIINTSGKGIEKFLDEVDLAVFGTPIRHLQRHSDTEEAKKRREAVAREVLQQERERLAKLGEKKQINDADLPERQILISVPTRLGNWTTKFWGRHTIYQVDLSKEREEIFEAFRQRALNDTKNKEIKLRPFPQLKPSWATYIKKNFLFSKTVIKFLRSQMTGRFDQTTERVNDIFAILKATEGRRLNYVLMDDKIVFAHVHPNKDSGEISKKLADWTFAKHAILSGRKKALCSGEIWYDEGSNSIKMNNDSGTYEPEFDRVVIAADLANRIFDSNRFETAFVAVEKK